MSQIITIIGTGNLAWHLAPALERAGQVINEVYGRSENKALLLTEKLNNPAVTGSLDFSRSISSLFIVAVSDNAIGSVTSEIVLPDRAILVHTSGTVPMSQLQRRDLDHIGVFYPLQTFSRNREINFSGLPLLIEASDATTQIRLQEIGESLGTEVTVVKSENRLGIHLAAVFANNFTNHMIDIAGQVMEDNTLDFNLLKPLIRETVGKALAQKPSTAQTGPAARGDTDTMQKHLQQLGYNPQLEELYRVISESIRKSKERGSDR